ncbi:MAG: sulfide/dihydroorotate dehydrogenase-like FAD/NAD-binding protein [Candidatus Omnitrophica bacterium]|jgi:ferredoxin--NADP+ reductase|nr:sulfide/dihydroorotate dehydrogenase-like FAD/NAD-binding protein [Candidatus Omnitrophota bacterium]
MFTILENKPLNSAVNKLIIKAEQIASSAKAGQFVVILIDDKGERIPLTLSDWDKQQGTITLIAQIAGATTKKLSQLKAGDSIAHILGPLGHPTETEKIGTVVCVAGGVGIAEIYPVAKAFKEAGNRVLSIIGARTQELLILQEEVKRFSDELFITTDDGSLGRKSLVTEPLKELFSSIEKSTHTKYPDLVYVIGPVVMMKAVSDLTKEYSIKTIASLNPIMVDATGMCGSCRCSVDGKTKYACVDGPDFDAHKVDFNELSQRLRLFNTQEKTVL